VSTGSPGDPAERSVFVRRLPLFAFCVLAVLSVAAFFITQKLKAADPVVWGSPQPLPSTFDPVGGRVCLQDGVHYSYRSTRILVRPTEAGRVAVSVYPVSGTAPVATISRGRYVPKSTYSSHAPVNWFTWNGREQDGRIAPSGHYYFQLVLRSQDNHTVDLTNYPIHLITSAHPRHGGCFVSAD
jgi:hypothetical protein